MKCPICSKNMKGRRFLDDRVLICPKHGVWIDVQILERLQEREEEDLFLGFLAGLNLGKTL